MCALGDALALTAHNAEQEGLEHLAEYAWELYATHTGGGIWWFIADTVEPRLYPPCEGGCAPFAARRSD